MGFFLSRQVLLLLLEQVLMFEFSQFAQRILQRNTVALVSRPAWLL